MKLKIFVICGHHLQGPSPLGPLKLRPAPVPGLQVHLEHHPALVPGPKVLLLHLPVPAPGLQILLLHLPAPALGGQIIGHGKAWFLDGSLWMV